MFAGGGHGQITRLPRIDPTEKHSLAQAEPGVRPAEVSNSFVHTSGGDLTGFPGLGSGVGEGLSLSVSDIFDGPFQDCTFWPVHLGAPEIDGGHIQM
jgi:hypothetical protein